VFSYKVLDKTEFSMYNKLSEENKMEHNILTLLQTQHDTTLRVLELIQLKLVEFDAQCKELRRDIETIAHEADIDLHSEDI